MPKETHTLPILLKNQAILLIGGGKVALQKAKVLFENKIPFRVITKTLHAPISKYTTDITIKSFKRKDIYRYSIVVDATGSSKVAQKLLNHKRDSPLLINVVDKPELCDFYFMALTKNSPMQIAVSSNGSSPTMAQYFRDRCQKMLNSDVDALAKSFYKQRKYGKTDTKKVKKKLAKMENKNQTKVYLVGCGLGDSELLTIKAYRVLTLVDVVLYDHLVPDTILALLPKKTKRIFVGKKKGFHTMPQAKINKLLNKEVKKGHIVARLKSGDPFVFGRGAEELLFLNKKGIKTEVVPGISSAISAPLLADIPVTARNYADGFTVVSAHLKGDRVNLKWVPMIKDKSHTVIVLMGLSRIKDIVQEATTLNIDAHTPCAIISHASRERQHTIITTLKELEQEASHASRPAILIFGNVVNYHSLSKESNAL
jgi:uroporphyrin-III C-methyltransferase/precorrin-2 dehydrogenase/sirohydrochlorin ferrochelatase